MDPITVVVGALVAGATSGLTDVAGQAVRDAYEGLKSLIKNHYQRVHVEILENDPADESRQEILYQDLTSAGADTNQELLDQAQALLKAVKENDPETAGNISLNLREGDVERDVDIDTLIAEAGNIDVNAERVRVGGSLKVKNIRTGGGGTGNR